MENMNLQTIDVATRINANLFTHGHCESCTAHTDDLHTTHDGDDVCGDCFDSKLDVLTNAYVISLF